jgi:hypothetical protein
LFFTTLLGNGIDRGIVEGFMGHTFGLDQSYLRMSDDELRDIYGKVANKLLFGQTDATLQQTVKQQAKDIRELKAQIIQIQIRQIEEDLHIERGPTEDDKQEPPEQEEEPGSQAEKEGVKLGMQTWDEHELTELQKLRKLKEELAKLRSGQPA